MVGQWSYWTGIILMAQYLTGMAIRLLTGVCPWDCSNIPFSTDGVMRVDCGLFWFFVRRV
ncbi:MAG: hypothetical protein NUV45_07905 [Tepidanaerobacteraceae bacterium]|jgi:uncharacterized membrane protein|nr:hypothetical protein [Tepidanaerobacteraceae bacterium]